jgi:hypothetical protein
VSDRSCSSSETASETTTVEMRSSSGSFWSQIVTTAPTPGLTLHQGVTTELLIASPGIEACNLTKANRTCPQANSVATQRHLMSLLVGSRELVACRAEPGVAEVSSKRLARPCCGVELQPRSACTAQHLNTSPSRFKMQPLSPQCCVWYSHCSKP